MLQEMREHPNWARGPVGSGRGGWKGGRLRAGMQACKGGGRGCLGGKGALLCEWGNALFCEGLGRSGRGEGVQREKMERERGVFAGTIKKLQLFVDFAVDESKGLERAEQRGSAVRAVPSLWVKMEVCFPSSACRFTLGRRRRRKLLSVLLHPPPFLW